MSDFEILLNETGTLTIRNLEITNKEVIDFIQSFREEEKETKVIEILEFGVKGMKSGMFIAF